MPNTPPRPDAAPAKSGHEAQSDESPASAVRPADAPGHTRAPAAVPARDASLLQVAAAVFWSFFGIRKNAALRRDAVTIKPLQVIIIGVLMAGMLVAGLLLLVRFIISG